MEHHDQPSQCGRARWLFPVVIGLVLFISLAWWIKRGDDAALVLPEDYARHLDGDSRLRPLAQFAESARAMKLVTVTVDHWVTSETRQEHWRGDVRASVEVPARYHYGVDLSEMKNSGFFLMPRSKSFVIEIPKPHRVSTEVFTERGRNEQVDVGWLRFKVRAGNFHLQQAYKQSHAQAAIAVLGREKVDEVNRLTLEQVQKLLQPLAEQFAGDGAKVTVRYAQ